MWCASSSNHTQLWSVANHNPQLYPYSPLLTVLHGTVDGIASSTNDITLCSTPQQSFDGLNASKAAGDVKRRLPIFVQLIHPRAQPRTHDLNEEKEKMMDGGLLLFRGHGRLNTLWFWTWNINLPTLGKQYFEHGNAVVKMSSDGNVTVTSLLLSLTWMMAGESCLAAKCRGVSPLWSLMSVRAWLSSNSSFTHAESPRSHARCSGVWPDASRALIWLETERWPNRSICRA